MGLIGLVREEMTVGYWIKWLVINLVVLALSYGAVVVGLAAIKARIRDAWKSNEAKARWYCRVLNLVVPVVFVLIGIYFCISVHQLDMQYSGGVVETAIGEDARWVAKSDGRELGPWALGLGYYGEYDVEEGVVYLKQGISTYKLRYVMPENDALVVHAKY